MRDFFSRLRHFALIRLCVEAAVLFIAIAVMSRVFSLFVPPATSPLHAGLAVLRSLLLIALLLAVYTGLVRWLERRNAIEIRLRPGAAQLPIGALIGMSLMSAVLLVLWALNAASFGPGSGLEGVGIGLAAALLAAVFEELLFRAVLYRIIEQCCGTTIALVVSACVFGLLHGMNAGATLFSDAAIAVEAGLLLAMAFALTRNLWLAIGIHAGWNFTEGSLFGTQVSGGTASQGVIHATLTGPVALTGGSFGPEASIVAIGVCGLAGAVFGFMVLHRGDWRPMVFRASLV